MTVADLYRVRREWSALVDYRQARLDEALDALRAIDHEIDIREASPAPNLANSPHAGISAFQSGALPAGMPPAPREVTT